MRTFLFQPYRSKTCGLAPSGSARVIIFYPPEISIDLGSFFAKNKELAE